MTLCVHDRYSFTAGVTRVMKMGMDRNKAVAMTTQKVHDIKPSPTLVDKTRRGISEKTL